MGKLAHLQHTKQHGILKLILAFLANIQLSSGAEAVLHLYVEPSDTTVGAPSNV